jgi:peroxiredoxin
MKKSKFKNQNSKLFICFLLSALYLIPLFAQKTTITGKIENNKFSLADLKLLYKEEALLLGSAKINADGSFRMTANISKTDLYKLDFDTGEQLMMCLSPNQNIELGLDAKNLTFIKSVKGSPSLEFCRKAAEMIVPWKSLIDNVRSDLHADKDIPFFNEYQSLLKPHLDANTEADAFCLNITIFTDSLQQYVNSKLIKGKVDNKDIDPFIYRSSNLLKEIKDQYTKYISYVQSMNLFFDFKSNRKDKFEEFYSTGIDKYLEIIELRDSKMETTFSQFMTQVERYLHFRDSLQIYNFDNRKKEKDLMVSKIISLSQMCPNVKETQSILINHAKTADGFARYSIQEAQRRVSAIIQNYQSYFDTENKKQSDAIVNLFLANKRDLAVLLFMDQFPRDQNQKMHQEIIKALHEKYPDHPLVKERYKSENSPVTSTAIGALAPELAFENPNGEIMRLSDLKGKVVLLDFWAGWCRPCRLENPNVVKLYHQYNKKGFEIFSVSLDRTKADWVKAIEADGLVWPYHVSELQHWQSQAAKIYGVGSIPATFLIDREGRIISKNLRGAALENALKELFD